MVVSKEQDRMVKTFYVVETSYFKANIYTYEVRANKISGVRLFNDLRDSYTYEGLVTGEQLVVLKLMQFSAKGEDIKRLKVGKDNVLHNSTLLRKTAFTLNKVLRYVAISARP